MSETEVKKSDKKKFFKGACDYLKEQEALIRDLMDSFALLVLSLYPFRNIHHGLDLWDTGYHLSNYEYMGLESMDPMWLFSTYLSNAIGHLMTLLPYGHTLLGMNFYTAFVPAIMAVCMYLFFTRHLKYPGWLVFIAEFASLSMCWSPTTALYHYLTYMIIIFSCVLLYRGITAGENITLALSGILCGLGIFVRFSNLPQFSLSLAIWMYGFFEFREAFIKSEGIKKPSRIESFGKTFGRFFWFVLGYIFGFLIFFIYLGIRYGFADYINGIAGLFTIQDNASGYSTYEMIRSVIKTYYDQLYWVSRLMVFAIGGGAVYTLAVWLNERIGKPAFKKLGTEKSVSVLVVLTRILGILLAGDAICFLVLREKPFVTFKYTEYWCCFSLAGMMCFIALVANGLPVFFRRMSAGDRLLAVLAVYALLISAIGGNNGSYSSFNNMFFWLPVTLKAVYDLIVRNKTTWLYGLKCVLAGVILFFMFQSSLFGMNFTFTETYTGAAEPREYIVEFNKTLNRIRMGYDKAYCMDRLSLYVSENDLSGRELITFGYIPSLHFYLQMAPAFNPWSDLKSYSYEKMSRELGKITEREEGSERPLIILCTSENGENSLDEAKWKLIYDFIEKEGYELTYSDMMFSLYE